MKSDILMFKVTWQFEFRGTVPVLAKWIIVSSGIITTIALDVLNDNPIINHIAMNNSY